MAEAARAMDSWTVAEAVGLGVAFFVLGYVFKVAVTRISTHNLSEITDILDTDDNGKIDRRELNYIAELIIKNKDQPILLPSLYKRIDLQEHRFQCWEAAACVLLLLPLVLPAVLYDRLGAHPARLVECGLLCLLPALFCQERALQYRSVAVRLKKQKKKCREVPRDLQQRRGTFNSDATISRETVRELGADGRVVREVVKERSVRSPSPSFQEVAAANVMVVGADRNFNGIPDSLEGGRAYSGGGGGRNNYVSPGGGRAYSPGAGRNLVR